MSANQNTLHAFNLICVLIIRHNLRKKSSSSHSPTYFTCIVAFDVCLKLLVGYDFASHYILRFLCVQCRVVWVWLCLVVITIIQFDGKWLRRIFFSVAHSFISFWANLGFYEPWFVYLFICLFASPLPARSFTCYVLVTADVVVLIYLSTLVDYKSTERKGKRQQRQKENQLQQQ